MASKRSKKAPKSHPQLQKLVELAGAVGEKDSSGEFTVHLAHRQTKLGKFQLPNSSCWLLKVVQAAVRRDAKAITIRQTRRATSIVLSGFGAALSELGETLVAGHPGQQGSLEHLSTALMALAGAGRDWRLESLTEAGTAEVLSCQAQVVRYQPGDGATTTCDLRLTVAYPSTGSGFRLLFWRGAGCARDDYLEVVNKCSLCPIPLIFDGRILNRDRLTRCTEGVSGHTSYLCLGIAPPPGDDRDQFPLPQSLTRPRLLPTDRFTDGHVMRVDGELEQEFTTSVWQLHYHFEVKSSLIAPEIDTRFSWSRVNVPSHCHWVSDGVVCQSDPLALRPNPIGLDLYLSGDSLKTDLSGLGLLKSEDNEETMLRRRQAALRAVGLSLPPLRLALEKHRTQPFAGHAAFVGLPTCLFLYAAVVTTPWMLVMSGALAPIWLGSAWDKKKVLEDCLTALRRLENEPALKPPDGAG